MGIRFAKSIKIGNFLRLNFSKSGLSATLGKKGASVNIGGKGAYLNLSPSAVGIKGTGLSYRQKIAGGLKKNSSKKQSSTEEKSSKLSKKDMEVTETVSTVNDDLAIVNEYNQNLEAITNIHRYTDNVMNEEEFINYVKGLNSDSAIEIYETAIEGDEDTIENLITTLMNNLELAYDVRVNFELEDHVLYVDLDLPEIEDLSKEYPVMVKDKLTYKRKTSSQLREEYARMVLSIGVFLSANFFNQSSYITEIVMSAFTTVRNPIGDLEDQYLYSIRFTRDIFEKTKLEDVEDLYNFVLQFENRINLSNNYVFKPIKPYESEKVQASNSALDDALLGLKELGYKQADINKIKDELSTHEFSSSSEYLREGLRLLKEKAE